jgi:competence ComEA-like helix-hairpin-helix protein
MNLADPESGQLPRRVQPLVAGLLVFGLIGMAGWYVWSGGLSGGLVHHDAPPPATARFSVDVNTAVATELAQLPGLGPTTAARIIEYREAHGPFAAPDSLLDVPGIGPVTLEAIRPHLRPLAAAGAAP